MQVVCGLLFSDGKVLATRRDSQRTCPLMWEFPGGKIEENESAEAALIRELREELNLEVRIHTALPVVPYQGAGPDIELLPFICEPALDRSPVPFDHPEIRWIFPDEAHHLHWAPADRPLVLQLRNLVLKQQ